MKALLSYPEELEHKDSPNANDRKPPQSDRELEVLFIRVFHIVEGAIKDELRRKGISPKIGAMLAEIYRLDNPSPIELARVSSRKPQTITAIIHRMKKKGLVTRVTNESKKNTCRLYLTHKGMLAYQKVVKINIFNRVTQNFTKENLKQFREYLEELSVQAKKL